MVSAGGGSIRHGRRLLHELSQTEGANGECKSCPELPALHVLEARINLSHTAPFVPDALKAYLGRTGFFIYQPGERDRHYSHYTRIPWVLHPEPMESCSLWSRVLCRRRGPRSSPDSAASPYRAG